MWLTPTELRELVLRSGKTLTQIAEEHGVSVSYVSAIVSGKKKPNDDLRRMFEEFRSKYEPEVKPIRVDGDKDVVVPFYRTSIRAGKAGPTLEDSEESFNVSEHYKDTAVYEVSGDSMILAGIEEGDRIVVRLGYRFKNRDVILCRYNGELMVKGAMIDKHKVIWLVPANKNIHPWPCKDSDEFQCIGRVVEVIRKPLTEWWAGIVLPADGEHIATYRGSRI